MTLWAEFYRDRSEGSGLGMLPLIACQTSEELELAGSFSISVSQGRRLPGGLPLSAGMRVRVYLQQAGRRRELAHGYLIRGNTLIAPGQRGHNWKCADLLVELQRVSTLSGLVLDDCLVSDAVHTLVDLADGWRAVLRTTLTAQRLSTPRGISSRALDSVTVLAGQPEPVIIPDLDAPENLTATDGTNGVTLSWDAVTDAEGYHILRDGVVVVTNWSGTSLLNIGLTDGETYTWSVLALGDGISHSDSPAASITHTYMRVVPVLPAPTGLSGTVLSNGIRLNWDAVANAVSYTVRRNNVVVRMSTVTFWTDTAATAPGTSYNYSVVAVGDGVDWRDSTAVTVSVARPAEMLASPGSLTASNTAGGVTLSWNAVTNASGYRIRRGNIVLVNSQTNTNYQDTTAVDDSTYTYEVIALGDGTSYTNSTASSITHTFEFPSQQLPAPSGLTASSVASGVALSWNAVTNASSYRILRGSSTLVAAHSSTSYIDTTAVAGTSYTYGIIAVGDGMSFTDSPQVTETVTFQPPVQQLPAPGNLRASHLTTSLTITWNMVTGASGYQISRDGVELEDSQTGVLYSDTDVVHGTEYSYSVVALGDDITTSDSEATTITVTYNQVGERSRGVLQIGSLADNELYNQGTGNGMLLSGGSLTFFTNPGNSADTMTIGRVRYAATGSGNVILNRAGGVTVNWRDITASGLSVYLFFPERTIELDLESNNDAGMGYVNWTVTGTLPASVVTGRHFIILVADRNRLTLVQSIINSTITQLATPANLTATGSANQILLSWDAVTNAQGYRITRGDTVLAERHDSTTYTDMTAAQFTTHNYNVVAVGDAVRHSNSAAATVNGSWMHPRLDSPADLSASSRRTGVALSWSSVTGATGYRVRRGTSTLVESQAVTTYTDTTAAHGTEYTYQAIALGDGTTTNNSLPSIATITYDRLSIRMLANITAQGPNSLSQLYATVPEGSPLQGTLNSGSLMYWSNLENDSQRSLVYRLQWWASVEDRFRISLYSGSLLNLHADLSFYIHARDGGEVWEFAQADIDVHTENPHIADWEPGVFRPEALDGGNQFDLLLGWSGASAQVTAHFSSMLLSRGGRAVSARIFPGQQSLRSSRARLAGGDEFNGRVSLRFDDVPVLEALREISEVHGMHFRRRGERTLEFGYLGEAEPPILHESAAVLPGSNAARSSQLVSLKSEEDASAIVNWIAPYSGPAEAPLTLQRSNQNTPWLVRSTTAPGGQRVWYIEDQASIRTFGLSQGTPSPEYLVVALRRGTGLVNAANVLYNWAANWLAQNSMPQHTWNATTLSRPLNLLPGSRCRIVYHDSYGQHEVLAFITRVEGKHDTTGSRWDVELSNSGLRQRRAEIELARSLAQFRRQQHQIDIRSQTDSQEFEFARKPIETRSIDGELIRLDITLRNDYDDAGTSQPDWIWRSMDDSIVRDQRTFVIPRDAGSDAPGKRITLRGLYWTEDSNNDLRFAIWREDDEPDGSSANWYDLRNLDLSVYVIQTDGTGDEAIHEFQLADARDDTFDDTVLTWYNTELRPDSIQPSDSLLLLLARAGSLQPSDLESFLSGSLTVDIGEDLADIVFASLEVERRDAVNGPNNLQLYVNDVQYHGELMTGNSSRDAVDILGLFPVVSGQHHVRVVPLYGEGYLRAMLTVSAAHLSLSTGTNAL